MNKNEAIIQVYTEKSDTVKHMSIEGIKRLLKKHIDNGERLTFTLSTERADYPYSYQFRCWNGNWNSAQPGHFDASGHNLVFSIVSVNRAFFIEKLLVENIVPKTYHKWTSEVGDLWTA